MTVLGMILAEGRGRAKELAAAGVVTWLDLPPVTRFRPILVVVDEASGTLLPDRTPVGIPKDHPLAVEAA